MSRPETPIDVFISYKREERDVAKALAEALAWHGYKVWWDIELLPGDRFIDAIGEVIKQAKAVIVLWSCNAVASDFVRAEAREAHKRGKLIPVRLEPCDLPLPFGELQTLNLEAWRPEADDGTMLEPLLRALEARAGKPPSPPQPQEQTEANLHGQDREADYWRAVSEHQPRSAEEYRLYLRKYPNGVFVDLARRRVEELEKASSVRKVFEAIVGTKNVFIALGAVAAAGTAVIVFGTEVWVRCKDLGWCDFADPDLPLPGLIRIPPQKVPLPATFTMGSETGYPNERPPHDVTFSRPFYMSQTPITFEHHAAFARGDGRDAPAPADFGWDDAELTMPAVGVSWRNAADYTEWLGEAIGASCRLPSEAEWEFACRAGTETAYWWGEGFDPTKANTRQSGPGRPTAVGTFSPSPNHWGLHEMSGNVWEWVEDCWHGSYDQAPDDGRAWLENDGGCGGLRVLRGGFWGDLQVDARCARRGRGGPTGRYNYVGFRVACSSPS